MRTSLKNLQAYISSKRKHVTSVKNQAIICENQVSGMGCGLKEEIKIYYLHMFW